MVGGGVAGAGVGVGASVVGAEVDDPGVVGAGVVDVGVIGADVVGTGVVVLSSLKEFAEMKKLRGRGVGTLVFLCLLLLREYRVTLA